LFIFFFCSGVISLMQSLISRRFFNTQAGKVCNLSVAITEPTHLSISSCIYSKSVSIELKSLFLVWANVALKIFSKFSVLFSVVVLTTRSSSSDSLESSPYSCCLPFYLAGSAFGSGFGYSLTSGCCSLICLESSSLESSDELESSFFLKNLDI